MQSSKSLFLATVALIAPLALHADSLNTVGSLTLNGLTFSNFSSAIESSGSADASPTLASQISVNTITSPAQGIEFSSAFLAENGSFADVTLHYNVASTSGISAIGLDFNGYFEGLGITSVTERVFNGSNLVGSTKVTCASSGCTDADEYKTIALDGTYNNLSVTKDIQVNAGSAGYAGLSYVDQTFTTVPVTEGAATPEPASMALFGVGLLAAGAVRRARKSVKA